MTFRKNSQLLYQSIVSYVTFALLSLALISFYGVALSLLCAFPFIVLTLITPLLDKEYITINENGILCQRSGKQLRAFKWNEIAELKKAPVSCCLPWR